MLKRMLALGKALVFSPTRGAQEARKEENLAPAFWLYAAFVLGYMVFFRLKPLDFPDKNAPLPAEVQDLFFWFKVTLWQPPLEAGWILFLLGLVRWFERGSWPVRFMSAVLWTAFPFILIVYYAQNALPKAGLAAGFAAWLSLFYPLVRGAPRALWRPLIAYMLGLNVIGVLLLAPMTLAVLLDAPMLFTASQAAGGFWILIVGTLGLRELTGLRLPRAFMSVLLSMFFQIALAFTLHLLGLVPKEILKALFYA